MKRLPQVRHRPAPAWQTQRLERWWREWLLDRLLEEPAAANAPASPVLPSWRSATRGRFDPTTADPPVEAGQVRLLHPTTAAAHQRLLYVVVLPSPARDRVWVAPFGRFAEPAVPGEWLTGRTEPALRVLCVWNARSVPHPIAEAGWLIDELSPAQLCAAGQVLEHHRRATSPTGPLARQVGPPLVHPLDPRWEYLAEEQELMEALFGLGTSYLGEAVPAELALAAEARPPYGEPSRLAVGETALVLWVTPHADPAWRTVLVLDEAGRPSNRLDGSVLQDAAGRCSAPVVGGQVTVPAALTAEPSLLVTAEGRALPLRAAG